MTAMVTASWMLVLLVVLATARLTTLVNDDYLLAPFRALVDRRGPDWAVYWVQCPWCVSVWAGGLTATLAYFWGDTWPVQIGLVALAASYVTGALAELRARGEDSE